MTQSQRVLTILSKLSNNKKVCTKLLCEALDENERNIQRDLKLLKDFFGESMVMSERGCYMLLNNTHFFNMIKEQKESKALKNFFEFLTLLDSKSLKFLEAQEFTYLNQIKKDVKEIYTIFDNPIEELKSINFLEELKTAIKHRRYCNIIYNEQEPKELINIQPQKILYAKNNWYLAAMTQNYKINGGFKRFRINFIENLTLCSKTFHRNVQAENHIKNFQSLFQDFNQPNYEVVIRVNKKVARYFRVKKHLSSQQILQTHSNGDLTISYQINNDMEIIPLIKTWIPHLKVISPKRVHQKISKEIKTFIDDI